MVVESFGYESSLRPGEKHSDGQAVCAFRVVVISMWGGENKFSVQATHTQAGISQICVVGSHVDSYIEVHETISVRTHGEGTTREEGAAAWFNALRLAASFVAEHCTDQSGDTIHAILLRHLVY